MDESPQKFNKPVDFSEEVSVKKLRSVLTILAIALRFTGREANRSTSSSPQYPTNYSLASHLLQKQQLVPFRLDIHCPHLKSRMETVK